MQFSLKLCFRKHKVLWNIHSSGKWGIIITLLSCWLQNFLLWHTSLLSALDYYSISIMTFSIKHFSTTSCFLNTRICCRSFRPWSFFKTFIFKLFSTFITFEILQKKKEAKITVCYYHFTYEFQTELTLYSLPECQGTPCSKQEPYLKFRVTAT